MSHFSMEGGLVVGEGKRDLLFHVRFIKKTVPSLPRFYENITGYNNF